MGPCTTLRTLLAIGICVVTSHPTWALPQASTTIILPGDEYHVSDLPESPSGDWWVLHDAGREVLLELHSVTIGSYRACGDEEAGEENGRTVTVPDISAPIVLLRGLPGVTAGPLRSAVFTGDHSSESERVELLWDGRAAIVAHETDGPHGDQPGTHWVTLELDGREFVLHEGEWHGDGYWRFRWMGDVNRDGWPDLLFDASYKYSVYTTRLFLSHIVGRDLTFTEAATFSHSAC